MYKTKAYDAGSATSLQTSAPISRRDPTDRDVQIEILFCGICHSDLHYARDEWHDLMPTIYPYGGYSDSIVLDEGFVLHIPANVNLAGTAPLLCAGITTYSPEPGTPSPPATPPTQPRPEIPPPPDEPTTPLNTVRLRETVGSCPERAVGIQPEFIPEPRHRPMLRCSPECRAICRNAS